MYILTANEEIYFIGNSEREYLDSIVNQINEFVDNSTEPSITIRTVGDNSLAMYIIGGILGIFSICFIFADDITCSFNKSSGVFYIRKQGIRGKRFKSERNINISDIRIDEKNRLQNQQTGKTHITYQLSLVLKSGENLLLDTGSSIENYHKIDKDIRQMINIK